MGLKTQVELESCPERRNDYWYSSGDAKFQIAVNNWASERYGVNWHDKYSPWEVEETMLGYMPV